MQSSTKFSSISSSYSPRPKARKSRLRGVYFLGRYYSTTGPEGKNSPYTGALATLIGQKEDIAILLRNVRDDVLRVTQGKQEPWEYGSLSGGKLVLSSLAAQ